jgi:two-component system response regulator FixJ
VTSDGTSIEERRDVIVVDDDPAVLHSLKFALELEGYAVSIYHDAAEVLAETEFPERGCMIVDHQLPGMTGLDMLAGLRARGTTMPAVLIVSRRTDMLADRAAAANIRIVEKPLLGDTLNQALDAVFDGQAKVP